MLDDEKPDNERLAQSAESLAQDNNNIIPMDSVRLQSQGSESPVGMSFETDNDSRSSINSTSSNHDDHDQGFVDEYDDEASSTANSRTPKLPLPLFVLYVMYGLTMSLPMLPMMYILNTKVPLPLSLLPTYGALSFMPFSFKPVYAYVSNFFPRQHVLLVGWTCCALFAVGWIWVPSVTWVFVLGIGQGVAMAWSGFLLGLTLLDIAQQPANEPRRYHVDSTATTNTLQTSHTFEKTASLFQSQAATARNIGSFFASIVTCLVFGLGQRDQTQWSEEVVNGMFWATAGCHVVSAIVILSSRETFSTDQQIRRQPPPPTQGSPQVLPRSTEPTYSVLEISEGSVNNGEEISVTDTGPFARPPEEPTSPFSNWNFVAVAVLQVSIFVLALKEPILHYLSKHAQACNILIGAVVVSMLLLTLRFCIGGYGARIVRKLRKTRLSVSSMAGLVLILRHSVPSSYAIFGSFLYHSFQSEPIWLQIFSLVTSVVLATASWSYQKIFATKYSHGRKLIYFMMVTTVVTYASNNLFVIVVDAHDDDKSLDQQSFFPWLVLGVKLVTSFLSEWNFLPSVVLATVSIPGLQDEVAGSVSTTAVYEGDNDGNGEEECDSAEEMPRTKQTPTSSCATSVAYGSLISCIDFGDQIGAVLSGPLVAALGITRENHWQNLGTMIHICSIIGMTSSGFLVLMLWWLPSEPSDSGRPPSPLF